MNRLSTEDRAKIIGCLVEGMSIRATVRVTGAAKNTVTKLLVDLGAACSAYQDTAIQDIDAKRVECDEIWSFCYAKQRNVPEEHKGTFGYGDVWTWTGMDAETKLMISWLVGERTALDAYVFIANLKNRLRGRIQLTTDGLRAYLSAVDANFGDDIDYAVLHKLYGPAEGKTPERRYSPAICTGVDIKTVSGDPEPKFVSTSYVERQNLTMRMGMRRFTRLTNAFSKKIENLSAAVSLHFMYYNFARPHQTLGKQNKYPTTPAMAAGLADHVWTLQEIAALLD